MISIVIPAYNEEKLLPACLDSLANQTTNREFEIIVVDNNSTDKTSEVAHSYGDNLPNLQVVFEEKKGRGQARSTGFAQVTGDIILSCDADTVVPKNWIEDMITPLENNMRLTATTSPCSITDNSFVTNAFFNLIQPTIMHFYRLFNRHYWLNGSSFAIRKEVYVKAGGFNKKLRALEDIDLARRVSKIGKIQFVGKAKTTTSGRRFQQNVAQGTLAYVKTFFIYRVVKNENGDLNDIR